MSNRLRVFAILFCASCIPAWPQVPIRPGQPDKTTPRASDRTPRVTPKRVIRLRPPEKGELPPAVAGATSEPEVAPTPPPLRVLEPQDPARTFVASVGNEQLTLKEVQDRVSRIRSPLLSGATEDVERYRRSFGLQIISDWVDDTLLATEARARGLSTTRQEVDRYIEGTAQESGLRVPVAERLRLAGISEDKFRAAVEDAILGDKLIRQTIRERVSDAVLNDALAKNPMMFWAPPRRHVQQLFHPYQGTESADERRAMESRMKSIRRRLSWFGGRFEDYVGARATPNVFLQDLWLALGDRLDASHQFIYSYVFRLEPPTPGKAPPKDPPYALKKGEISDVVASDAGFHIFKVIEDVPARRKTIQECRADVENSFFDQVRTGLLKELERKHPVKRDPEGLIAAGMVNAAAAPPRLPAAGPSVERGAASFEIRPETARPVPSVTVIPTTRTAVSPLPRLIPTSSPLSNPR